MTIDDYLRFAIALVAVLALIALFAWMARRIGLGGRYVGKGAERRLAVLEVLPLDGKRRLVLLRRDTTEHLVLLGHDKDLLIEAGIDRAAGKPAEFATLLRREAP